MTDKQALRRHFRTLRAKRNDQAIRAAVAAVLQATPATGHLGLYWPLKGETDLRPLLPVLQGRKLALPCSDGGHNQRDSHQVGSREGRLTYHPWDQGPLHPDGCGIPAPTDRPALKPEQLQLLLVPALAMDFSGIRLGYGGGYYDRLRAMPAWRQVTTVAVVPASCISTARLPRECWDQPFDGWVCETGVHWCGEGARGHP
ncbi:MAG: 5-formyltetrahydrofolate cyclo-ligase [Synechococcus sp.]